MTGKERRIYLQRASDDELNTYQKEANKKYNRTRMKLRKTEKNIIRADEITPVLIEQRNILMNKRDNQRSALKKINTELNRRDNGFRGMAKEELLRKDRQIKYRSKNLKDEIKDLQIGIAQIKNKEERKKMQNKFERISAERRKCKNILTKIQKELSGSHRHKQYIRIGIYRIDEVLPYIGLKVIRDYDGHKVKMWSQRYFLFAQNLNCVECGLKGEFFALERDKKQNGKRFHFNLYGHDDNFEEIMLTKDHIIPKSKGGTDTLDNYQTMCFRCNQKKADAVDGDDE